MQSSLIGILKKDKPFKWEMNQENYLPFLLTTIAVSGVLRQETIGKDLFIAYTSRLLNAIEKNYPIGKECLVIIYCLSHFRLYLFGGKFTISNHNSPFTSKSYRRERIQEVLMLAPLSNRSWTFYLNTVQISASRQAFLFS